MVKISALGVLRLRAVKPSVYDRSAKRFAQDDGFVGVLKKNIPNKLALMGRPSNALPGGQEVCGQEQGSLRME
jgi:hypothetical protein